MNSKRWLHSLSRQMTWSTIPVSAYSYSNTNSSLRKFKLLPSTDFQVIKKQLKTRAVSLECQRSTLQVHHMWQTQLAFILAKSRKKECFPWRGLDGRGPTLQATVTTCTQRWEPTLHCLCNNFHFYVAFPSTIAMMLKCYHDHIQTIISSAIP